MTLEQVENVEYPSYQILLRRVSDGVERLWNSGSSWSAASLFLWTEGNFSCDCNRQIFFCEADGEEPEVYGQQCGLDQFLAVKVIFPDGNEFLLDVEEKDSLA